MRRQFQLCYITDRRNLHGRAPESFLLEATEAGLDMIQVREKDLATQDLLSLAAPVIERARDTAVIINDRLDVALALRAAGVHLGQHSMPAAAVKSFAPGEFLIGVSCHSLNDALAAELAGADYLLLGPVFETPSKLGFGPPLGLDQFREAAARVRIPVLALGGITPERVRPCLEAGAAGIAGIRIFQDAPSLNRRVAELRAQFL
ncbi:MAG TPA: thiamine phosphate synthase [Terriglobia bacterium]|nr:thiamine phosphate synthase [Terriglobia bacterium]